MISVGIFDNYITTNLLLNLPKSVNIWQSCRQEGGLSRALCAPGYITLLKDKFTRHLEYGEKQLLLAVIIPIFEL